MQHAANSMTAAAASASALKELHRQFESALARVADASDAEFLCCYRDFMRVAESMFRLEEHWMDTLELPMLPAHRHQHARMLMAMHRVHAMAMDGDIAIGRGLAAGWLPQWFAFHVATTDCALGAALDCIGEPVRH